MNKNTLKITQFGLLLALTVALQLAGLPPPVTGPLVNAVLIITAMVVGPGYGILLGVLTPVVALVRGHLPPVLYMMIPFIALGNGLWTLLFYSVFKKISTLPHHPAILWMIAVLPAAVVKFVLLSFSVRIILPLLLGSDPPEPFVLLMTIPQLITAIIGGILAFGVWNINLRYHSV